MNIAGLQKCSLVDYPGKVAAVVFTPGCNMNCHYCHNAGILGHYDCEEAVSEDDVISFLARRSRLLDGLVISGGEPTLQTGLVPFIRRVRELGLLVKLDTNGTRPSTLTRLVSEKLVDFIAMDLKAPMERYTEICQTSVDVDAVSRSIRILLSSDVENEFRTTFSPLLTELDVLAMVNLIPGAQRLVLQQYRLPDQGGRRADPVALAGRTSHPSKYVRNVARKVQTMAIPCQTRGLQ
jgi:pyruvate formate lyase activating enzyme